MKTLTDLWLEGRKKVKTVIEDKPEEEPVVKKTTTRKKSTAKADTEKEGE